MDMRRGPCLRCACVMDPELPSDERRLEQSMMKAVIPEIGSDHDLGLLGVVDENWVLSCWVNTHPDTGEVVREWFF